jgi:hypothetical protein
VDGVGERYKAFQLKNGVAVYGGFAGTETSRGQRSWRANVTILSGDLDGDGVLSAGDSYHVLYHPDGAALNQTAVLDGFTIAGGNADGLTGVHNCGGGMLNWDGNSPAVTNCTFSGNWADYGAGMMNSSNGPTVANCTFDGNVAEYGGGMLNWMGSSPTVTNCTFNGNEAGNGGAMLNWMSSSPTVTNCVFSDNLAGSSSGGMGNWDGSDPAVTNCVFSDNHADWGAGMENWYGSPTVANCTFVGNSADSCGGGMDSSDSSPTATNCIFWGNTAPDGPQVYGGTPTITYSDVQGGWPGTGNIDADPIFVSGPRGDCYLSQTAAGQGVNSPCVDAGSDTAADLGLDALTTRTDSVADAGSVDMGCHAMPGPCISSMTCSGDDITIHWDGQPGVSYVVEWSTDHASWNEVSVGEATSWTDTDTAACACRFYRVREAD